MKRLTAALIGIFVLALAASGGATANPHVGACPPKSANNPFELVPVTDFQPGIAFIDLNQNGLVCASQLPFNPNAFAVIDDLAQKP
jgi:hypothetical protein